VNASSIIPDHPGSRANFPASAGDLDKTRHEPRSGCLFSATSIGDTLHNYVKYPRPRRQGRSRRETCSLSQTALFSAARPASCAGGKPTQAFLKAKDGGAGRDRTDDLKLAKLPLSQLSYSPLKTRSANIPTPPMSMVGLGGLEPPTSRLSGVRSNHLSYRPIRHAHSVSGKRGDPARWRGLTGKRNEDDGDCLFCQ
jgi:hypothetical protein